MVEVADIFRLHGGEYRTKFGDRMPGSHSPVMHDIETCRTPALGGRLYLCDNCVKDRYSYHSCKNRHCPKCQNNQATEWLRKQEALLLPVAHFLVTFTFPAELRDLARSNQRILYNILFRASSEALAKLAADPRHLGVQLGMIGVLHTWTRDLRYHPHVHYVVTAGGIDSKGHWRSPRKRFLVPGKPLALIFRGKVRDMLDKAGLLSQVDDKAWQKDWVVDLQPVGSGQSAFKYLAPYIFRVAISNNRIVSLDDGKVTFRYKDRAAGRTRLATLSAEEFIRRFLQHVLLPGFVKVRYYGLLSPSNRKLLKTAKTLLRGHNHYARWQPPTFTSQAPQPATCSDCGGPLRLVAVLAPLKPP